MIERLAMEQHVLARNNVQVIGSTGQPSMFAHGFGYEQRIWRLMLPAFAGAYRLVLFDYVGSGKSECALSAPLRLCCPSVDRICLGRYRCEPKRKAMPFPMP
jgi:pimeloyl-ACP methyl ester carboxylesterase